MEELSLPLVAPTRRDCQQLLELPARHHCCVGLPPKRDVAPAQPAASALARDDAATTRASVAGDANGERSALAGYVQSK